MFSLSSLDFWECEEISEVSFSGLFFEKPFRRLIVNLVFLPPPDTK
jgi:hypothetical protein